MIKKFNLKLKSMATKNGFNFFDIYSKTVNNEGYSNDSIYLDRYHLKPECYIELPDSNSFK